MINKDTINLIRAEIAQLLEDDVDDIFGEVHAYPTDKLENYPAAVVMPSDQAQDYSTTADRKFGFGFRIYIYYPVPTAAAYEKAELALGEAVAVVLKIFSKKGAMTTCDWAEPSPSSWDDVIVGDQPFRRNEVILRCIKYLGNV